jgi:sporulation protein YlmC with PRC-barrel domain
MGPQKMRVPTFFWTAFWGAGLIFLLLSPFAFAAGGKNGPETFRASQIIDETVSNDRGEEIGEVDDLIMSRSGKIREVVLSVGGFSGTPYRLVAVSFKALRRSPQGGILYNVTPEQLDKYPSFSYRREGFLDYLYYSPPPPYGGFMMPPRGYQGYFPYGHLYGPSPKGRYRGEYGAWGWEYYPERLRVSALLKRNIWNEEGQEMAEIDDLIIGRDGRVETIVLSVGELLGLEEKLVAVPYQPLKVSGSGIVFPITREQLKKLPEFKYEKR